MDTTRLFEASQTGNTMILHQLLVENPLILHTCALSSSYNPLHVASTAGHADFVKEILRLKPEFAKQLNEDGYSPIHIASANGHLEIVRELLRVDRRLCRIEGRNKWTPLHFAASRGRSNLIKEMLMVCAESLEDVTVQKETALHLAIKNSQFEAIDVMLRWIKENNRDDTLNMRDEFGNSILHLATWRKDRQVVEWIISFANTTTDGNLNAVNQSGLTPLDLLLIFPSEAGDREIHELLLKAGAKRANDTLLSPSLSVEYNTNQQTVENSFESECDDELVYFKFKKGRDSPSDARGTLLVMAVLVATATFQVGINPPSGVWQDTDLNGNGTTPKHEAGKSIMGSYSSVTYLLFVTFNSIGLSLALYMLTILTSNLPMRLEFRICVVAVYFTYYTSLTTMAPDSVKDCIIVFSAVFPSMIHVLVKLVRLLLESLIMIQTRLLRLFT